MVGCFSGLATNDYEEGSVNSFFREKIGAHFDPPVGIYNPHATCHTLGFSQLETKKARSACSEQQRTPKRMVACVCTQIFRKLRCCVAVTASSSTRLLYCTVLYCTVPLSLRQAGSLSGRRGVPPGQQRHHKKTKQKS